MSFWSWVGWELNRSTDRQTTQVRRYSSDATKKRAKNCEGCPSMLNPFSYKTRRACGERDTHTWTILFKGRCCVRSISARCSTGLFRVEVNRSAVPTVRRASRSTCDNSAQTHYSRPEVLWLPSHLYRKATLTPTHTRETHTRTHTHTTQTPLFSLLTANLSKRGAVGGGG